MTPPSPPAGFLPVANWRYWDVIVVFFTGAIGSVFVAAGVVASGADPLAPLPFSLIFGAQVAFSLAMVWFLSRSRGSGSLAADVGLIVKPSDWWGVFAGMGLQVAIAIMTAPIIVWFWPDGPPTQGVAGVAESSETFMEQVAVLAVVAVGAPIIEEIIFRGMLLSILSRSLSMWPAILISAAIFSAVHLLDPDARAVVPGLFLLGIALGWVTRRRGDLSLAIAMHSGINLLAAITLLYGDSILKWAELQVEQLEAVVHLIG
ncbi:MAG: CPBP family intramembrane glutamic endopeptidase [Acidimicrobiia bacterium]